MNLQSDLHKADTTVKSSALVFLRPLADELTPNRCLQSPLDCTRTLASRMRRADTKASALIPTCNFQSTCHNWRDSSLRPVLVKQRCVRPASCERRLGVFQRVVQRNRLDLINGDVRRVLRDDLARCMCWCLNRRTQPEFGYIFDTPHVNHAPEPFGPLL